MFLKLILGTFGMFSFLFVLVLMWRSARPGRREDFMFDFRSFEPGELERLKSLGLLSDEEAKKVQSVITDRAVKWSDQKRKEKEEPPVDMNTLLMEASELRRQYEQSKAEVEKASPQDPEE